MWKSIKATWATEEKETQVVPFKFFSHGLAWLSLGWIFCSLSTIFYLYFSWKSNGRLLITDAVWAIWGFHGVCVLLAVSAWKYEKPRFVELGEADILQDAFVVHPRECELAIEKEKIHKTCKMKGAQLLLVSVAFVVLQFAFPPSDLKGSIFGGLLVNGCWSLVSVAAAALRFFLLRPYMSEKQLQPENMVSPWN